MALWGGAASYGLEPGFLAYMKYSALAAPVGMNELSGKVSYFTGNDPLKWHTDIPTFMVIGIVIFLTPVFFYVIQWVKDLSGKWKGLSSMNSTLQNMVSTILLICVNHFFF